MHCPAFLFMKFQPAPPNVQSRQSWKKLCVHRTLCRKIVKSCNWLKGIFFMQGISSFRERFFLQIPIATNCSTLQTAAAAAEEAPHTPMMTLPRLTQGGSLSPLSFSPDWGIGDSLKRRTASSSPPSSGTSADTSLPKMSSYSSSGTGLQVSQKISTCRFYVVQTRENNVHFSGNDWREAVI